MPSQRRKRLAQVPHHLVDHHRSAEMIFRWHEYQKLAKARHIGHVQSRGKLAVISGGTGLYLNSLLYEMDFSTAPEEQPVSQAAGTACGNRRRMPLCIKCWKNRIRRPRQRIHPNNIKKIIRALERLHEGEEKREAFSAAFSRKRRIMTTILIGLTRDRAELYDRINRTSG